MLKKVKVIAQGVTFSGAEIPVGEFLEVSVKSADALIESGYAESTDGEEVTDPNAGKQDGGNEPTEEQKQAEALEGQYKRDELYAAAKEAGVDIAFDAKKGEIIAAVIAQGFAAALIK